MTRARRAPVKGDVIVLEAFVFDVWAIHLALSKRQCRREGRTPVVSDAAVVCLRPGGVPGGFVPAVTAKRGRG